MGERPRTLLMIEARIGPRDPYEGRGSSTDLVRHGG